MFIHIERSYYTKQLHNHIAEKTTKIILLHGWRWSGKTTLLKQLMSDSAISQKKYYFSFDEDIVAKKFKNAEDFRWYMQIKYGINFSEPSLLLLNEIQYSKNILSIFLELLQDSEVKTTIIATWIIHSQDEHYNSLVASWAAKTITVHPLSFFDFLNIKNIHTTYLSIEKPSLVMFREIQWLFDEYLIRWWYPEIIKSTTRDRKQYNLKAIVQKVYDKDIWFYFNGDEILIFQELMERLCHQTMEWCKYKTLSNDIEISITLLKKYIHFFKDNCLINIIPYFFTDKKKELSHQETIGISDMGIMSYMTHHYWSKLHNIISIRNFIGNEIIKYISDDDQCMTYQKVNNSSIDFIIVHNDNTITPIIISEKNTDKAPKVFKWFHDQYWSRIRKYIKTTPLIAKQWTYNNKEFVCVPHFMIKVALWY
jgi:uncharacterized protein